MNKVAILDYGSQLTHLLATEVRRLNVYSEILDSDTKASELKDYIGIILSGGPSSVYEDGSPQLDPAILELGIPVLGICYGHQLIVKYEGGKVESAGVKEYGKALLNVKQNIGLMDGFELGEDTQVWMSHGDDATVLPTGYEVLASTEDCKNAVIGNPTKNIYSLQFHVEVNHTVKGRQMLANFLKLCNPDYSWNLSGYLEQKIAEIKAEVADKKVFLMISGGVDSTVAFALLNKAIGSDRVYGLFVDTGFMRLGEVEQVTEALKGIGVENLHVYDGASKYFEALKGVYDPEHKRKIIGDLFLDIQAEVSDSLSLNPEEWLLGQGTIYPDTIESGGTKNSQKIKTHHNRVERIAQLIEANRVIEPVKDLYKDEVRQIGKLLGLPEAMVERHPFPGPGLAVRCLCFDSLSTTDSSSYDDQEEAINLFLANKYGDLNLKALVSQIKSVGVQGDGRTYRHPLILIASQQAVESNFGLLLGISTALTNQFNTINRVILSVDFDLQINSLSLLEKQDLNPTRISVLQKADSIFNKVLRDSGDYQSIWQAPLVLAPIEVNSTKQESVIMRPISSKEAMTADVYPLSVVVISQFVKGLKEAKLPLTGIFYDLTHKPPGTIEWE